LNYARKRPRQIPPKERFSEETYYLLKELFKKQST